MGSGTTAIVSQNLNRKWIGFDIDENYAHITTDRLNVPNKKVAQEIDTPLTRLL